MPSKSAKQHRFMEMVAHNPKMAKKVGVPQSVGRDFSEADKGKKFAVGGINMINRDITRHGRVLGASKSVPENDLTKYIGKKKGGKIMAMQRQRGVKTDEPFNPKNVEDGMKKGGKVMEKESKSESKKEQAMDKKQDVAMIKKAFKEHDAQEHKGGKGTKIALKKGGMAKESMGPRTMSKDVEKGSNKLMKFGQSAVQKRGLTKGKEVKMAKGGKVKRYDEGGDVDTQTAQGQNANIGDDTRARAMAALASGNMDQQVPTPVAKPRMKSKPKSNVMTKAMGNMNPMGDTYKKGGDVKKMARGGGIEQRGKTRGRFC